MLYRRIETIADLDALRGSTEGLALDFKGSKSTMEPEWREMAKDVAAFANHVGGAILVGASENPNNTCAFFGLEAQEAARMEREYDQASRHKCVPSPTVVCKQIALDSGKVILAVNVEPYPDQLVGAMMPDRDRNNKAITSDAWRFYVRINKDNIPLTPDKLAMFMNPEIRRTVIRLEAIPTEVGKGLFLMWRHPRNDTDVEPEQTPVRSAKVDVERNVLELRYAQGSAETRFRVPLDDVEAVWESSDARWIVRVTGHFDKNKVEYISNPRNATFHSRSQTHSRSGSGA